EEGIDKLRAFIPDTTLVAALDVVDRDRGRCPWSADYRDLFTERTSWIVLRYKTPWGRSHYEIFGSTSTYYTVFPRFGSSASMFCYCTCPAFAFSVLVSNSHLMCKHVLAVCLAERLSKCIERTVTDEEFVARTTAYL
ncbi:hypothetical protein EDD16DRAFT_1479852, partial [Pisolithus croceorrhizus]